MVLSAFLYLTQALADEGKNENGVEGTPYGSRCRASENSRGPGVRRSQKNLGDDWGDLGYRTSCSGNGGPVH